MHAVILILKSYLESSNFAISREDDTYATICQPCVSTEGKQTSLHTKESDIRNSSIQEPITKNFSLLGHSVTNNKVVILFLKKQLGRKA